MTSGNCKISSSVIMLWQMSLVTRYISYHDFKSDIFLMPFPPVKGMMLG